MSFVLISLDDKKEAFPFRSVTDLKGYKDGEECPDEGLVDQDFEPLESIVARFQRGEIPVNTSRGYYEDNPDIEGSPVDSADFDLADASAIQASLLTPADAGASPSKATEPEPPTPLEGDSHLEGGAKKE